MWGTGWEGCKVRARAVMCTGGVLGVSHGWHLCGAVCVPCEDVRLCWGCDGCVSWLAPVRGRVCAV